MARGELTPLILTRATASVITTAYMQDIDKGTGLYIKFFDSSQNNQQGRLLILAAGDTRQSTDPTSRPVRITIRVSTNSAYTGSGQGKLELDLPRYTSAGAGARWTTGTSNGVHPAMIAVGPIETARFLDTDNRILIDWSTKATGAAQGATTTKPYKIGAIVIP